MAKTEPKKKTSPVFWVGLLVICAAAYVLTEPEQAPKSSNARRAPAKETKLPDGFVKEDFSAKFAALNTPAKNAFQPKVVALKDRGTTSPNALPGIGGGSWIFTGTAEVDGKRMALIENGTTGEGQFLQVGDAWGQYSVSSISDNTLRMRTPDGGVRTISMEGSVMNDETEMSMAAAPVTVPAPQGPLRGPIGGMDVRPLSANASPQQNDRGANENAN